MPFTMSTKTKPDSRGRILNMTLCYILKKSGTSLNILVEILGARMKTGAGILGILLGVASFSYVALMGALAGGAAGYLGHFGPSGNAVGAWGEQIVLLSLACSLSAMAGGVITFSRPMAGAILLAGSAVLHFNLLGYNSVGQVFGFSIGLTALLAFSAALQRPDTSSTRYQEKQYSQDEFGQASQATAYDRDKWRALVDYDEEIAAIVEEVRPLGDKWVDEFASSYMALNDKKYIPEIILRVTARANSEAEAQAEAREELARHQRQREEELQRERERRAEQLRALKASLWGSRDRQIATTCISITAIAGVIFLYYLSQPSRIDAQAVWSGNAYQCTDVVCLAGQMEEHNASKKAVKFAQDLTKLTGNPSWATNFYRFHNVDLVAYDCAMPKCTYQGSFALVNGSPHIIPILSELEELPNDPVVRGIPMIANGSAFLTRYYGFEREFQLQDGTERLVFAVSVSTCEACQPSGAIEFAYDFDQSGKLIRRSALGYVSPVPARLVFPPGH